MDDCTDRRNSCAVLGVGHWPRTLAVETVSHMPLWSQLESQGLLARHVEPHDVDYI